MASTRVLEVVAHGRAGRDIEKVVAAVRDEGVHIEGETRLEGPEALVALEKASSMEEEVGWMVRAREAVAEAAEMVAERESHLAWRSEYMCSKPRRARWEKRQPRWKAMAAKRLRSSSF